MAVMNSIALSLTILLLSAVSSPQSRLPQQFPSNAQPNAIAPGARVLVPKGKLPKTDELDRQLRELRSWAKDFRRAKNRLDPTSIIALRDNVRLLQTLSEQLDDQELRAELAFLELLGDTLMPLKRSTPGLEISRDEVREILANAINEELSSERGADLREILGSLLLNERAELERHVAAAFVLKGRYFPNCLPGLLKVAATEDPTLREHALNAICGWTHEQVNDYLVSELVRTDPPPLAEEETEAQEKHRREQSKIPLMRVSFFGKHLESAADSLTESQKVRLIEFLTPRMAEDSWRVAARSLQIAKRIQSDALLLPLIQALEAWTAREGTDSESLRIQWDLADDLMRRSGRTLGKDPARWRRWWDMVQAGQTPPPSETEPGSMATFFSLRPVTARVTFVIDRSGSMSARFQESEGTTRFEEAVRQVGQYLEASGPNTRFGLVLFSNETLQWKSRLQQASERNIESATKWLMDNGPAGGTQLRDAIEQAIALKPNGTIDLRRLEADTMIVLCDGDTDTGSDWVAPTISKANEEAQLVFHCVQIGSEGDGTLETLSEITGGTFIQVGL